MKVDRTITLFKSMVHHGVSMVAGALYFTALMNMSNMKFIVYFVSTITMLIGTWILSEMVSKFFIKLFAIETGLDESTTD